VRKDVALKTQSECARVSLASGSASQDILCWPFDHASPVTVKWLTDHRLLVTVFKTSPKTHELDPQWAKIVGVASGETQGVPVSELGKGAIPPSGPTKNAAGETAIATGKDGNLTLTVHGPAGTQTLLTVRDSNAGWGIQSGPACSPDGKWILWSDAGRLLVTTPGAQPSTRILSTAEVFGLAAEYGIQVFSQLGADLPLK